MRTKKGFNLREVCGQHVVIAEGIENIDFNNIISMNETAAYVWGKIQGKDFNVEDMVNAVMEEYEVDAETAQKDCIQLAKNWLEAGICEE